MAASTRSFQHLHVLRVDDVGFDRNGLDLLLTTHGDAHGAAAGTALDGLSGELLLGAL